MMRGMRITTAVALVLVAAAPVRAHNPAPLAVTGPRPVRTSVWASNPTGLTPYPAGIRPWLKLADIKGRHAGQVSWSEALVNDGRLMADYVSAAPAEVARRALLFSRWPPGAGRETATSRPSSSPDRAAARRLP